MSRLIDADALGKRINKRLRKKGSFEGKEMIELGYAMLCLHEAETVDTERHGHWIEVETPHTLPYELYVYKCSECHAHFCAFVDRYHYCPNCGAKMDEVGK